MDWGDVGLGASGAIVVLTLTAAGTVAVGRRRRGGCGRASATA